MTATPDSLDAPDRPRLRRAPAGRAATLSGNSFLRAMTRRDRAALSSVGHRRALLVGDVLHSEDDPCPTAVFPLRGMVSTMIPLAEGDVEAVSRGRTGAIGHLEACFGTSAPYRTVVQIEGDAVVVAAAAVRALFEASPEFRSLVLRRMEQQLAEARVKSVCRAAHPATLRLIRNLLSVHDETGLARLPLTQEALSGLMGVRRSTVTHAAGRLQDLGLIRYARGIVRLRDLPGLEAHACECRRRLVAVRTRFT